MVVCPLGRASASPYSCSNTELNTTANVNAMPLQNNRGDKTAIELFLSGIRALALQSSIIDGFRTAS
jgi:hypothetical protein